MEDWQLKKLQWHVTDHVKREKERFYKLNYERCSGILHNKHGKKYTLLFSYSRRAIIQVVKYCRWLGSRIMLHDWYSYVLCFSIFFCRSSFVIPNILSTTFPFLTSMNVGIDSTLNSRATDCLHFIPRYYNHGCNHCRKTRRKQEQRAIPPIRPRQSWWTRHQCIWQRTLWRPARWIDKVRTMLRWNQSPTSAPEK